MQLDIFNPVPHTIPLVYRKSQKSAVIHSSYPEHQKRYDFKTFISIRPKGICEYQRNIIPDITIANIENSRLPIDNKHHGLISKKANKQVHNTIDWFVLLAKDKVVLNPKYNSAYSFRINFITLTLPSKQMHGDKQLQKELFSPFLDWIRKTNHPIGLNASKTARCTMYFWRAESQSNGNIHWHLCCDCFIPYMIIKTKWNSLLNKLGYIDTFAIKWNHRQPNSTDVHSIKQVNNISAYLSKYCGKNTKGIIVQCSLVKKFSLKGHKSFLKNKWRFPTKKAIFFREIHSRLWSCSENLSKLKSCKIMTDSFIDNELKFYRDNIPQNYFNFKYCNVYKIDAENLMAFEMIFIRKMLANHVLSIIRPPILN